MTQSELRVRSGQVTVLRLFNIADEIDLKRAEELWARGAQGASTRSRLAGTPSKAVSFGVPPLALELRPITLDVAGAHLAATAGVRLYDFGVAVLALHLPAHDLAWSDYVRLVNHANQAVGATADAAVWTMLLAQLRALLSDALIRPNVTPLQEDYLIAFVDGFDEPMSADALQARVDLVPLLSGEERALSEGSRRDLLKQRFSYYPDDLVAMTWDRAFIYEPRRETDVADVLEIANAQLLEMRAYDELLDDELPRMHDLVEATRRRTNPLAARRYARLARRLYTLVAEVTELAERVDNALQVTEDVYLARVYASAMDLFRVPNVSAAVDRKLAIIRETYAALHSEAAEGRAVLLEITVVALITLEVVLSLWRH
jgi:hypothetical protein